VHFFIEVELRVTISLLVFFPPLFATVLVVTYLILTLGGHQMIAFRRHWISFAMFAAVSGPYAHYAHQCAHNSIDIW
jgi:hypothetical protein